MKFIRFVGTGSMKENPWLATGIVTVARDLANAGVIDRVFSKLEKRFAWLNDNVPVPPFEANKSCWGDDDVCWFLSSAAKPISRMQPIIKLLRSHSVIVRTLRTNNPGKILYRDEFQVVARTPKSKMRIPK